MITKKNIGLLTITAFLAVGVVFGAWSCSQQPEAHDLRKPPSQGPRPNPPYSPTPPSKL